MKFEGNKEKEAPTTIVMSSVFMCEGEDGKGHSREAISDSGTNINVMSKQAAEKLQSRTNVEKEERGGGEEKKREKGEGGEEEKRERTVRMRAAYGEEERRELGAREVAGQKHGRITGRS